MENNSVIFIVGAIISPLITMAGLLLQYSKDRKRDVQEQGKRDAEAEKVKAEAEKVKIEAKALDIRTDMDTVNFYIGMVSTLRDEVNALTELSRKNGGEIALLTAKLISSDEEKKKLAIANAELIDRINKYETEVRTLRDEVALLKRENLSNKTGEI